MSAFKNHIKNLGQVTFLEWTCDVYLTKYDNGQNALLLQDAEDNSPIATASVALDIPQSPDEVFIKDYSENAGILDLLIKAGIISTPVNYENSGFVVIPVCTLLKGV